MIVLDKNNYSNLETLLSITGRDIESQEEIIQFDKISFKWKKIKTSEELLKGRQFATYDNDPVIITIKKLLVENPKGFEISSNELLEKIYEITGIVPIQKNVAMLTKYVNQLKFKLQQNDNIFYEPPNHNGGSKGRKMFFCIPNNKKDEKYEPIQESINLYNI